MTFSQRCVQRVILFIDVSIETEIMSAGIAFSIKFLRFFFFDSGFV